MSQLIITLTLMALAVPTAADETLPKALDLSSIRAMVVQYDGRWLPLDTLAHDLVESVTGDEFYHGHDPVLLFLSWTWDHDNWLQEPLISINNAELRVELELPSSQLVFSYTELSGHERLHHLVDELAHIKRGQKLNPLEAKVSKINEKLIKLQSVFLGQVIKPIPNPDHMSGAWRSISSVLRQDEEVTAATKSAWLDLRNSFLADDPEAFSLATDQLLTALSSLPAAHRPSAKLISTEIRYNSLRPFRSGWIAMVIGALLSALALLVRRKWLDVLAALATITGFLILTYGLSLRWQIAGRVPASNMFESLLFLSWGMGAFAILSIFGFRDRTVPLTASAMGALSLLLADCLPLDHYIRPIAPVLHDTIWMSIHVPIIMVSYSVLALAVLVAHFQVIVMAITPRQLQFIKAIDTLHYWYMHVGALLLFVGIFTGSMWAASSWGRYWGWDPKEVWSLIAFLGYMAIIHVRVNHEKIRWVAYGVPVLVGIALLVYVAPLPFGKVSAFVGTCLALLIFVVTRGHFAAAVKSILAFWMIIMTYVGVNYVLGIGLHSYGFGTGTVATKMFWIGGIDLLLVALCSMVYLIQRWLQHSTLPKPQTAPL